MEYYDSVLKNLPVAAWKINPMGTNFYDAASLSATSNGADPASSRWGAGIIAGSDKSLMVGAAGTYGFPAPQNIWSAGKESRPFTFSLVYAGKATSKTGIVSHSAATPVDGLSIDSDRLYFTVVFAAGAVSASWNIPDNPEAYHVACIYTPAKIQLIVNGDVVSENSIPEELLLSGFSHGSDAITSGGGTGKLSIDGLAFFDYVLSREQLKDQFNAARNVIPSEYLSGVYLGNYRVGAYRQSLPRSVFDASNWSSGEQYGTAFSDGVLSSEKDEFGASLIGSWQSRVILENMDGLSISGIRIDWESEGPVSVLSSVDGGTTWNTAKNGELMSGTQAISDPSSAVVLIKIDFPEGITQDFPMIYWLTATPFVTNKIAGSESREWTILGNVSTSDEASEPIVSRERSGIHFYGGKVTVSPDTEENPLPCSAVEVIMTCRGNSGTIFDQMPYGQTSLLNIVAGKLTWAGMSSVYVNGAAQTSGSYAVPIDQPIHILANLTSSNNVSADVGDTLVADANKVSLFANSLTAQQAKELYSLYYKTPTAKIVDTGLVRIEEPAAPYLVLVSDWTNLPQQ